MKAVVYDSPRSFTITEVPTPDPGPGEVRVRVQQTGICGTDLHIHNGKFFAEFPLTPGHELVGPVDALGSTRGEVCYCRDEFMRIRSGFVPAWPSATGGERAMQT